MVALRVDAVFPLALSVIAAELRGLPLRVLRRDSLFFDSFFRARTVGQNWAVFPDGKEFVMIRPTQSAATTGVVVINWQQLRVLRAVGGAER